MKRWIAGVLFVCTCCFQSPRTSVAASVQYLYWTSWDTGQVTSVRRKPLESGSPQTLLQGSGGNVGSMPHNFGPEGIAVDYELGSVFWADVNSNKITRAKLDGSSRVDIVTGLQDPSAVAVDAQGGKIYWTDTGTDKLQRANLDGSGVQDLVTTGMLNASGLTLDIPTGKIYWSDFHTDVIRRANLNGTNVETLVTMQEAPSGIALVGSKMYWSDWANGVILRANLNGTSVETFLTGLDHPTDLEFDATTNRLYYIDWGTHRIDWISLDKTQQGTALADSGISSLSYFDIVTVPEPASQFLIIGALSALAASRRRRNNRELLELVP